MATDAHGTLLRISTANTRGSRPARAPLKGILVCELAAAMKLPSELVKPTMPLNQENQAVKCRDRSRNGVTSPPSTLIPATGPFQSANPATAAQLDSTYKMVITRIEVKTVIGMYRLGFLDSSARAPEFSQPTKPETARAKVKIGRASCRERV